MGSRVGNDLAVKLHLGAHHDPMLTAHRYLVPTPRLLPPATGVVRLGSAVSSPDPYVANIGDIGAAHLLHLLSNK